MARRHKDQDGIGCSGILAKLLMVGSVVAGVAIASMRGDFESQAVSGPRVEMVVEGADMPGCRVSEKYPHKVKQWCELITRYSEKNGLEPDLVAALIWQESGGNPVAYSRSGAVGLMQVMPRDGLAANFQCKNGPCFANRPTIKQLQDPEFNIRYGTGMLGGLVKKYGNIRDALMYYGPMDVEYYYANKVMRIYENYK